MAKNLWPEVRKFLAARSGNVAMVFAIAVVPLMIGAGGAVDYSRANSAKTAMQKALDSAALALVKTAANTASNDLTTNAGSYFTSNYNRPDVTGIQVSAQYDSAASILTLNSSGAIPTSLLGMLGLPELRFGAISKAMLGGSTTWPVCVLITNPDSNHTELVKNGASIDLVNCLNQVNTANWDAVEARDTSYIHSTNGVNCFTGDIHYGDVQPAKQVSCTMLPDPFSTYNVPTNACTYTNMTVNSNVTLSPGTYCGGLKITGNSNVILSPGLYFMQTGDFQVLNSSSLTANGVTILLSGQNTNININTTGTITMSPNTDAGNWSGFIFYWDQPSSRQGQKNVISGATMNVSGILYFAGQTLSITGGAKVTVNPGAVVADFLLPDNGHLTLTGVLNSPTAAQGAMKKSIKNTTAVLVQ